VNGLGFWEIAFVGECFYLRSSYRDCLSKMSWVYFESKSIYDNFTLSTSIHSVFGGKKKNGPQLQHEQCSSRLFFHAGRDFLTSVEKRREKRERFSISKKSNTIIHGRSWDNEIMMCTVCVLYHRHLLLFYLYFCIDRGMCGRYKFWSGLDRIVFYHESSVRKNRTNFEMK
jgi:hypothetical protein